MLTPVGFNRFRLANTEFVAAMSPEGSSCSCFYVSKPSESLFGYHQLRSRLHFARVLLLTGHESGSAALTCLVGAPSKLVSVSADDIAPDALLEFAAIRGFDKSLSAYHGIPPDDVSSVRKLVESEFDDGVLDVVIDDVSNSRPVAVAAFQELFPRLRPGGTYVIERWGLDHKFFEAFATEADMTDAHRARSASEGRDAKGGVVAELVPPLLDLACHEPEVVAELVVNPSWVEVRRGPAELDISSFSLRFPN